jgi:hypothetical protein
MDWYQSSSAIIPSKILYTTQNNLYRVYSIKSIFRVSLLLTITDYGVLLLLMGHKKNRFASRSVRIAAIQYKQSKTINNANY